MTKLTKKEYDALTKTPPNPLWAMFGYFLSLLIILILMLGMVWLIKILIEAIF